MIMGYYSNDRNTYHRQRKPDNSYISPYYGEVSYTDPTKKQSQGGKYLSNGSSDYDPYEEEEYRQPKRRTRKKIRVPSVYLGGFRLKLPSLQLLLLLAGGILAFFLKYKLLFWLIGSLGVFLLLSMSGARYSRLIVPQRVLCAAITLVIIVLASFGGRISFGPFADGDVLLSDNAEDGAQIILPAAPVVTTEPSTTPTEATTEPTEPPTTVPPPETKPLRLSHDGINLDMPLHYNENGGNYYHTTDMCSAVGADYLPLTGKLIYEDLSVGKFKSLKRCTTCSAPVRPHTH